MDALFERLLQTDLRARVVQECASIVELHLRGMAGLRGLLARTTFDALRRFRPAFVTRVLDRLLPDFLAALDDAYRSDPAEHSLAGDDFSAFMLRRPEAVVEALLRVSDHRVAQLDHPLVNRLYARLRRMAESEIGEVVPDLAAHLPEWLHDDEPEMDAPAYLP